MNKLFIVLLLASFTIIVGCQPKGPAEKAGERVDEVGENIKDGEAPLKERGSMEDAGEAVDEAVEDMEK
jgi:hypothetical protein